MHHSFKQAITIKIHEDRANELMRYLHSDKFSIDENVNRNDIIRRIQEFDGALTEIEMGRVPDYLEDEFEPNGRPRTKRETEARKLAKERFAEIGKIPTEEEIVESHTYQLHLKG